MSTFLTVLIVLASIVLILVVLVQKSKGGGLSSGFSSSNAIMGVRKTTDFIERATWGLAGFILVLSIVAVMIRPRGMENQPEIIMPQPTTPTTSAPDMSTEELPSLPIPTGTGEQPAQ